MENIKTLSALKKAIKVGTKIYCDYCYAIEKQQENINKIKECNNNDYNLNKIQAYINGQKEKMYNTRTVDSVHSNYITIDGSRLDWPKSKDFKLTDDGFEIWDKWDNEYRKILVYTIIKF